MFESTSGKSTVSSLQSAVLDALYPPTCVSCQADGAWSCEACCAKVGLRHRPSCPRCGAARHDADETCVGTWPFASLVSLGSYGDPVLRTLITQFKYQSASCLLPSFDRLLKRFRDEWADVWPWAGLREATLVPVPVDPKHAAERGMDHAFLLAGRIREALLPWAEVTQPLVREPRRWRNADLGDAQTRQANVHQSIRAMALMSGEIFLVDDVVTSGATASEAARALLQAGADHVHLITLAVG